MTRFWFRRRNLQKCSLVDQKAIAHFTLRQKTLAAVGLAMTGLIGILYIATSAVLVKSYSDLEQRTVKRNVARALEAYSERLENLNETSLAWATWDDTYSSVQRPNPNYIQTNLSDDVTLKPSLNVLLFLNTDGQIVYGESYDSKHNRLYRK